MPFLEIFGLVYEGRLDELKCVAMEYQSLCLAVERWSDVAADIGSRWTPDTFLSRVNFAESQCRWQ